MTAETKIKSDATANTPLPHIERKKLRAPANARYHNVTTPLVHKIQN